LNSFASFGGKYVLCLSPRDSTSEVIMAFSTSSFDFSSK
jgi:hypothetical protein